MSAQNTPGSPPAQIQGRPRRTGVPTRAQFNLLVDCVQGRGAALQRRHSIQTMKACENRGWITVLYTTYVDSDNLMKITEQGRACVSLNSQAAA